MRQYEELTLSSVEDLIAEMPPLRGAQQRNYYRGHANEAWELKPALLRADLEATEFNDWIALSNSNILKFKQLAPADIHGHLNSELEWLATASHHHVPTHFTAWSEAALVGLYFATVETGDRSDGALWRLMPGHDEMTIYQDYEQVPDACRIYHPRYQTSEMMAQRTCFLTHPLPDSDSPPISFENYYSVSSEPVNLCKIVIPHEAKADIRRQIAALGIDSRSIFPGLKGIGLQLSEDIYSHSQSYDWIM